MQHRYGHEYSPSPRFTVKAYTCVALVTLVPCDARIHHPSLAPLFDDVQMNSTRRLEAKASGEEGGRANRVRRLPDLPSRLPRRPYFIIQVMNKRDERLPIPDVQGAPDTRRLAIDRVGVKSIRHPVRIRERAGGVQHTVALFNMYVGLPHHFKGTHMSRFIEILNAHEREISPDTFRLMLREMVKKLEAASGHIEMTFPYFVSKKAPISGVESLMDYEVTFIGEIHDGRETFTLKRLAPVTRLCS